MRDIVILAPHVDDEMIGCFTQLHMQRVKTVYYFYEVDDERHDEAISASEFFGFEPVFLNGNMTGIKGESADTIFMVPNINDAHPDHKAVNQFAKRSLSMYKLRFYSVDMNVKFNVLSTEMRARKESMLKNVYLSQAKLFENEKYFLFESDLADDANRMIWVKFQREGIHAYPAALLLPELEDVSFLGYPHRHIFHFKVSIEVMHDDRDIEFIQFKRFCENLYSEGMLKLQAKSCEMIADELSLAIRVVPAFRGRKLVIEVSEDNENGAVIEYLA